MASSSWSLSRASFAFLATSSKGRGAAAWPPRARITPRRAEAGITLEVPGGWDLVRSLVRAVGRRGHGVATIGGPQALLGARLLRLDLPAEVLDDRALPVPVLLALQAVVDGRQRHVGLDELWLLRHDRLQHLASVFDLAQHEMQGADLITSGGRGRPHGQRPQEPAHRLGVALTLAQDHPEVEVGVVVVRVPLQLLLEV